MFQFPTLSPSPPTFTRVLAVFGTVRRTVRHANLWRRIILNLKTGWDFYKWLSQPTVLHISHFVVQ